MTLPVTTSFEAPEQCVILGRGFETTREAVGDNGSRFAPQVEAAILDELLWRLDRFKFRRVLLLTAGEAPDSADYLRQTARNHPLECEFIGAPHRLGSAGALRSAADRLDPFFYILDGGALFDFNWLDLVPFSARRSFVLAMALRPAHDAAPSCAVALDGDRVVGVAAPSGRAGELADGGVWLASRDVVANLPEQGSLAREVLPALSGEGRVIGRVYEGLFVDAAEKAAGAEAIALLCSTRQRPAVFLDRDGVVNVDRDFVHRIDQFEWIPGAIEAIKLINDSGRFVFIVTNQSGVARGFYDEAEIGVLHDHMQRVLRIHGAYVDDIRYCPFHPDGVVAAYARASDWRKPAPGMILDLIKHWPVDVANSLLIGDKPRDIAAGEQAGIRSRLFTGGNLLDLVAPLLR